LERNPLPHEARDAAAAHDEWHDVQRRFYDATAETYAEDFEQDNPYFTLVADRFMAAIGPRPGDRILEFGVSGGRFMRRLLAAGAHVTGVDISPRTVERLQRRLRAEHTLGQWILVVDDVASLGRVQDRDFDAVVGGHILHHVPDVETVLARARERLRPGGYAVFLEPNPWNPLWYLHIALHPQRRWSVERGILRVGAARIRRAFLAAGFAECHVTTFGALPPQIINRLPAAAAIETWSARLPGIRRLLSLNVFAARAA
jgi:SAM-dependent methyltransferase